MIETADGTFQSVGGFLRDKAVKRACLHAHLTANATSSSLLRDVGEKKFHCYNKHDIQLSC